MLVCLGSKALLYQGFYFRHPFDLDLMGTDDEILNYCKSIGKVKAYYPIDNGKKLLVKVLLNDEELLLVEGEMVWPGNTAEKFVEIVKNDSGTKHKFDYLVPSLDLLYLIKMSHRYLKDSPHFIKTMRDIQEMRKLGAKIPEQYFSFFKERESETYHYQHPKLNQNKDDFFNGDGVTYIYDHDAIHEAVKHLELPAYLYFKEPEAEVMCSKKLFFEAPEKVRLYAVLEEAYVLALERSQIPFRGQVDSLRSFEIALMKVCTSITSGWFRQYAWEHYDQVMGLYNPNYADKFFQAADSGLVKLHGV